MLAAAEQPPGRACAAAGNRCEADLATPGLGERAAGRRALRRRRVAASASTICPTSASGSSTKRCSTCSQPGGIFLNWEHVAVGGLARGHVRRVDDRAAWSRPSGTRGADAGGGGRERVSSPYDAAETTSCRPETQCELAARRSASSGVDVFFQVARAGAVRRHQAARRKGRTLMEPVRIVEGRVQVARPRRRRHRPDHPEAVPEADRAHRLRRVPLLRLAPGGPGARPGLPDPRRRAATSAAAPRASTPSGRSRTSAFEAVVAPSFADIFYAQLHARSGLLPVTLPEDDVRALMQSERGDRSTSSARSCVRRP